jgi:Ni2+-binding GTPase involved in maturation of urease and hydrogenase
MRDPKDIARAVETFGAETILIRNPNVCKIESNHADRDVENYEYDYIIENDGTLKQLEKVAKLFVFDVICGEHIPDKNKPLTLTCSKY